MEDVFEFDYEFKDENKKNVSVVLTIKAPENLEDHCIDTSEVFYEVLDKVESDIEKGLKEDSLSMESDAVLYNIKWYLKEEK